jgi:CHAD domain-containing protein
MRVALGQIDEALDRLEGRTEDELGTAVHESRKSLKRVRAVARLVRDELGAQAFARENESFRDAGRMLSGLRDSQILIDSLERLAECYPLEMRTIQVAGFQAGLADARDSLRAATSGDPGPLALAASELRSARERVEAWQLRQRGFAALRPGVERIYVRGRGAYDTAIEQATPENLHEWRKRTKDLWYSLQLLEAADPARMKPLARTAHRLSELLGDDHDLLLLSERVRARPHEFADPDSAALLRGLCERRRGELHLAAFGIGSRLYREPSASFVGRIERRWRKAVHGS